uniref:FBA_2 domain-containing protein n=1 Tax=Steinernema glaseri TaxID=37863 RepID=A0A1I7YDH0_9BILA
MDSVPLEFCHHVLGNFFLHPILYKEMEKELTGRWKDAIAGYVHELESTEIYLYCDEGEWSFQAFSHKEKRDLSLDELLAKDGRFFQCSGILVGSERSKNSTKCSMEDARDRLIPFLFQQSTPETCLFLTEGLSTQDVRMCLDFFQSYNGSAVRQLNLTYYGQESEEFLAAWLERDCSLESLTLDKSWPLSESVEDLVLKFILTPACIQFHITGWVKGELTFTPRIIKAMLDAWAKTEKALRHFHYDRDWNGAFEDVISLPLPPNVVVDYVERDDIQWLKEDGAWLTCSRNTVNNSLMFCGK